MCYTSELKHFYQRHYWIAENKTFIWYKISNFAVTLQTKHKRVMGFLWVMSPPGFRGLGQPPAHTSTCQNNRSGLCLPIFSTLQVDSGQDPELRLCLKQAYRIPFTNIYNSLHRLHGLKFKHPWARTEVWLAYLCRFPKQTWDVHRLIL